MSLFVITKQKYRMHSPENNEVGYQQEGRIDKKVRDTRGSEISLTCESISSSSMLKKGN